MEALLRFSGGEGPAPSATEVVDEDVSRRRRNCELFMLEQRGWVVSESFWNLHKDKKLLYWYIVACTPNHTINNYTILLAVGKVRIW